MGKVTACVLLGALVAAGLAAAPGTAQDPGDVLAPILEQLPPQVLPPAENETGQDLHNEDIRIRLFLDIVNVDYQVVGIVFGGGKVGADIEASLRLEFRAVSMARLDEALRQATGEHNVSVASTFGIPADRIALTAEEVRAVGAGQLLAAFEAYEAAAARRYLEGALPGLAVLGLELDWSNTAPLATLRALRPGAANLPDLHLDPFQVVPLREPPIVLDGTANLRYLQRTDLVSLLEFAARERTPEEERLKELKRSVRENETGPVADRTAFQLMGFGQILDFQVPPGWQVDLEMRVPQGFTVEGASGQLLVQEDQRGLHYQLDGDGRVDTVAETNLVTLSNRYLVTVTGLVAILVVGYAVRLPLEVAFMWVLDGRNRRGGALAGPRPQVRWVRWPWRGQ